MKSYPKYQNDIQLTEGPTDPYQAKQLQQQMGFNYRQAIGELIYALTICRVDISPALTTLSQHSAAPAKIHYDAVKQVFLYLHATKHQGLTYWRTKPREDLPYIPHPGTITAPDELAKFDDLYDSLTLYGACDATWASDKKRRRSMGGVVLLLSGAAIYYRTNLQPTIALSTTESEFNTMADAGKAALFIRWILDELQIHQYLPTPIKCDNHGAIKMANAQQPT